MDIELPTNAEFQVLDALWQIGGTGTVRDIQEHLVRRDVADGLVQLLLKRLEARQLVSWRLGPRGVWGRPRKFWTARYSREELVGAIMDAIVAQMFGGSDERAALFLIYRAVDLDAVPAGMTVDQFIAALRQAITDPDHAA